MDIASIAVGFPSLRITNDDLLNQVTANNQSLPHATVEQYRNEVQRRFEHAGSEVRYFRDRGKNETAYSIMMDTIHRSLRQADLKPSDIDLIIYCGVGRGFIEPAMSYFVAAGLGASCECFDILDACMSWLRALYVAYSLFAGGGYRHALIVNAEFNIYESGYPSLTEIRSHKQWEYTFPAFTIGEAATATVLAASGKRWNFHFKSVPKHVQLCSIPLKGYADYSDPKSRDMAPNGIGGFMCFGDALSGRGRLELLGFITRTYGLLPHFDKWFPHLATGEPYKKVARFLGVPDAVYTKTFSQYGNLVSASIPVALEAATREGELKRGDHIVLCPVSAGMSLALVDLIY